MSLQDKRSAINRAFETDSNLQEWIDLPIAALNNRTARSILSSPSDDARIAEMEINYIYSCIESGTRPELSNEEFRELSEEEKRFLRDAGAKGLD